MRYLSVCSGVEAASVAWHDLGWTPVGFSEIEPFPSAVLAHRFPEVKNYGDMTKYKEWDLEPGTVDVLVGGTPCQSFSVAGLRKGLEDPRGNLMLVYLGLAEHLRVPWLVWENVPGVLSSNGGRDFGTFLGALGELGYRWSFRVLDAQHFGVPQRRRRVFVVASLGDRPHPASVLFEPESLRGDSAKGSKARKGAARGAGKGAAGGGRPFRMTAFGQYEDDDSGSTCKQRDYKDATDLIVQPVCATGHRTHTLRADGFDASEDGTGRGTPIVPTIAFHPTQDPISSAEVTHALGTGSKGGCATVAVAMVNMQGSKGNAVAQADGPSYTLSAMHGHDVHAVGVPVYEVTGTLGARASSGGGFSTDFEVAGGLQAFTFAQNTRDEVRLVGGDGQTVGALAAQPGMKQTTYLATTDVTGTLSSRATAGGGLGTDFEVAGGLRPEGPMAVRRLLPVECERLQGFPDDHTNIPWRGKPAPDGPRYKAMGNSFAVPVVRWIGQRLDRVAKGVR
jgi:DNA (cytosine-5)-methyltransferase 1